MSSAIPSLKKPLTEEESYAQRRELFKNIWRTAMKIGPDTDIMTKPKIIKTLRIDEVDQCPIGKSKKERIKNLRHVCNKILDFCDKQEADDAYYQGVSANEHVSPERSDKAKKTKVRHRKKVNQLKDIFPVGNTRVTVAHYTTVKKSLSPTRNTTKSPKLAYPKIEYNNVSTAPKDSNIKKTPIKIITGPSIVKKRLKSESNYAKRDVRISAETSNNLPTKKPSKKKCVKKKKPSNANNVVIVT